MSNGSTTTTGINSLSSTLEDCPTNVFQIAELNGLKWCCLGYDVNGPNEGGDQILLAYTECLEANLLCTWRRRPPTAGANTAYSKPIPKQDAQKELWIFWYTAEEPKQIKEFRSRGLIELMHSESAEADGPRIEFEYETRTLFFKALNNAIERRLLPEGFVRFGRWLCRPMETNSIGDRSPKFINAIRFNYFLHRDSLVCASIAIQRQPTIMRLAQCHLEEEQRVQPIILGPWSIRANLIPGQAKILFDKENELETPIKENKANLNRIIEKQWAEWKRTYPALDDPKTMHRMKGGSGRLPSMVLVQLNGQSMLYPALFIGILADEQLPPLMRFRANDAAQSDETASTSATNTAGEMPEANISSTYRKRKAKERRRDWTNLNVARSSFGDGCLRFQGNTKKMMLEASSAGVVDHQQKTTPAECMSDFNYDYMRREFCYCRICPPLGRAAQRGENSQQQPLPSSSTLPTTNHGGSNNSPQQRSPVTFHRITDGLAPTHPWWTRNGNAPKWKSTNGNADHGQRNSVGSKWVSSFAASTENTLQKQQQTTTKREHHQLDQLNSLCEKYRQRIAYQQQQFVVRNQENARLEEENASTNSRFLASNEDVHQRRSSAAEGPFERKLSISMPTTSAAGTSELERMIMGDDDEGDEQNRAMPAPTKEDPLGLLQQRSNKKYGGRRKWIKRKRRSDCILEGIRPKRLNWPRLSHLDTLNIAFEHEDSEIFALDPSSSLPSIQKNRETKKPIGNHTKSQQPPSLLMKLLQHSELSPNPSTSDEHQQQPVEYDQPAAEQYPVMAEVANMDEYAVTPPALLYDPEMMDQQQYQPPHAEEDDVEEQEDEQMETDETGRSLEDRDISTSPSQHMTSPPGSSTVHSLYHLQQQHTPQHNILSPPASNERIDGMAMGMGQASSNSIATSVLPPSSQPYQPSAICANAALLQESLSRIYPTPPTPMQQFSPQNIPIHLLHQHQPMTEQGLLTTISYFSTQLKNLPWEEPIYDMVKCQRAHNRKFCSQFLFNSDTLEEHDNDGHQEERVCCYDCVAVRNESEQDQIPPQRLKRPCCEHKLDKLTFSQQQPSGGGPMIALQLHAMAQRRTPADTNLEMRLQREEWRHMEEFNQQQQWPPFYLQNQGATFPMGGGQHQQQFPPFQMGGHPRNMDIISPFPPLMPHNGILDPTMFQPGTPHQHHQLLRQASLSGQLGAVMQAQRPKLGSLHSPLPTPSTPSSLILLGQMNNLESPQQPQKEFSGNTAKMITTRDGTAASMDHLHQLVMRIDKSAWMFSFLIQDTIADLHYDIVFDACPLCCCNSNIRSFELGFYIVGPTKLLSRCDQLQQKQRQQQSNQIVAFMAKQWSGFRIPTAELQKCICGFSAVRHRYLCGQGSGLFPDDIEEAGGSIYKTKSAGSPLAPPLLHFNPSNVDHCRMIDLIRHLIVSREITTSLSSGNIQCQLPSRDASMANKYYTQSPVDSIELCAVVDEILNHCGIAGSANGNNNMDEAAESTLHPWGYQRANAVGEPRDSECLGIFEELRDTLRDYSPFLVPGYSNGRRLEQFTLRTFARSKSAIPAGNKDEDNSRPEPIPNLMALSNIERELVLLSPTIVRHWEQLELMPIDQPKDVLYLAMVPDVNVIAEKCKIFLEEMNSMYERRCRLGTHIRLGTKESPRDAIFRVGRSTNSNATINPPSHSLHNLFAKFGIDHQHLAVEQGIQRLASYVEHCVQELSQFFSENDSIFDRRAYLESACRQQQNSLATSLASPPDANAMPPPAIPGTTMLFTSSGPASATASAGAGGSSSLNDTNTGPGSASSPNLVHNQRQQESPSGGSGPNSVPILHGIVGSNGNETVANRPAATGIETADELAKREDKLAKDLREQVELLLAKEPPQLPHTVVVYLVNPFGQQLGSAADNPEQPALASKQFSTLATAALLCAWNDFLSTIPFKRRPQLQLEILPLRNIYDHTAFIGMGQERLEVCGRERASAWDSLRRMAFGVYAQPRLIRPHIALNALSKNMTRFGTAERMKDIFQTVNDNPLLIKRNCSPFLLAPTRSINFLSPSASAILSTIGQNNGVQSGANSHRLQLFNADERILLLAYCLLPNEDWLCATVTDERGSLLDTALINLALPPGSLPPAEPQKEWRHKQRHSQIADALQRLWTFIQSVILGQEVHQWRLVVSRMGKLGHGEFKLWNEILSKRNLRAFNSSLKSGRPMATTPDTSANTTTSSSDASFAYPYNCFACANSHGWQETPTLLSACLVSTEAEPHLRVFGKSAGAALNSGEGSGAGGGPNSVGGMGGGIGGLAGGPASMGGNSGTTKNAGPKGTSRQSLQAQQLAQQQMQMTAPEDRSLTHIVVFPTILNVSCQQQEDLLHGGMDDDGFAELLNCFGGDGGPDGMGELVEDLVFDEGARNEEEAPIDNQPMAIGFSISTAPVWPWAEEGEQLQRDSASFWSSFPPTIRQRRLAHLKSSLHINSTNLLQTDEYQQQSATAAAANNRGGGTTGTGAPATGEQQQQAPHPLDLANTDEVLRYVLETQNALSWLSLDPVTGARFSCLPIHMQAVYRLARSIGAFFGTGEDTSPANGQQEKQPPTGAPATTSR